MVEEFENYSNRFQTEISTDVKKIQQEGLVWKLIINLSFQMILGRKFLISLLTVVWDRCSERVASPGHCSK